jgi:hypothetical protein
LRKSVIIAASAVAAALGGVAGAWYFGKARLEAGIDAQVAALAGQGLRVTIGRREVSGFPLAYDVTLDDVTIQAADGAWSLSLPWAHVRMALPDIGGVRTTIAPQGRLDLAPQAELGDDALSFGITSRDLIIDTRFSEAETATTLVAAGISFDHTAPAGVRTARIAFGQIEAHQSSAAPGAQDLSLEATSVAIAYDLDMAGGGRRAESVTLENATLRASGTGWNAPSFPVFVNTGGSADIALEAVSSRSDGLIVAGFGAPEIRMSGAAGASSIGTSIADGRIAYRIVAQEPRYSIAGPPLGGEISASRTQISFDMPIRPEPEATPYALKMRLEGVRADDAVWNSFDPEGRLARDPVTFVADLGGKMRMAVDIANAAESRTPPVDVRSVDIAELSIDALGAQGSLSGSLRLPRGPALPDGALSVRLVNWAPALEAVTAAGLLPPDRAQMLTALAQTYGRAGDAPGVLVSDIVLEGGAITANGQRVR